VTSAPMRSTQRIHSPHLWHQLLVGVLYHSRGVELLILRGRGLTGRRSDNRRRHDGAEDRLGRGGEGWIISRVTPDFATRGLLVKSELSRHCMMYCVSK